MCKQNRDFVTDVLKSKHVFKTNTDYWQIITNIWLDYTF